MPILVSVTLIFVLVTVGVFFFRTAISPAVTVSVKTESDRVLPDESGSPLVNINTADKQILMTLPGVGEVLAERILDYRSNSGGFKSLTDLMHVEGIGEKRMEELLDYITTGG